MVIVSPLRIGLWDPFQMANIFMASELGLLTTLPETNISPEKWGLGAYFPFGKAYFQGLC